MAYTNTVNDAATRRMMEEQNRILKKQYEEQKRFDRVETAAVKAGEKTASTGVSYGVAIGLLLFALIVYFFDILVFKFNGIDINIFTSMDFSTYFTKGEFLALFLALLVIEWSFLNIDRNNRRQVSSMLINNAVVVLLFLIAGGAPECILHIVLIFLVWWLLARKAYPLEQSFNIFTFLLFFDFVGYILLNQFFTMANLPSLAVVFGNRIVFPIVIFYLLIFISGEFKKTWSNYLIAIFFIIIIFGIVNPYITPGAYTQQLPADQVTKSLEFLKNGVGRISELGMSMLDVVSCATSDPLNQQCKQDKYYQRHPDEKIVMQAQQDPEKYPTKIYFKTESNQKIPKSGLIGLDSELYVQSNSELAIELSCEIKKGDKVVYSGKADPENYPVAMIGKQEPKHITVTCRPEGMFENFGRDFSVEFFAEVKKKTSDITLKRVVVSDKTWLEDFKKSPYTAAPYSYKAEESARAEGELAGIVFKVGSQTLLDYEGYHKLSGIISNQATGRITKIYEGDILFNSPLLKPGEGCSELYQYDSVSNILSFRPETIPSAVVLDTLRKDENTKSIPQCNIEIEAADGGVLSTKGGEPIDILSRLVYDYKIRSNAITFEVEKDVA